MVGGGVGDLATAAVKQHGELEHGELHRSSQESNER